MTAADCGQSATTPQVNTSTRIVQKPSLVGFSLTLVQGDMKGPQTSDGVPQAAAKALADLKDFLPYKGYTLLDTAWVVGTGAMKTQLRRSETVTYDVEMALRQIVRSSPLFVSGFRVHESGAPSTGGRERGELELQAKAMQAAVDTLRSQVAALKAKMPSAQNGKPQDTDTFLRERIDQSETRLADFEAELLATKQAASSLAAKDSLIDTSFQMNVGETVVVGTSRLQGDKALIVLVTAVGK
ncbi:MAG: hypothetical protein ABI634_04655 [Acidobacteriota bacterium]